MLPNLEAKNLFSEEKSTQTVNLNLNVTGTLIQGDFAQGIVHDKLILI